jgi:hypothetical protein
MQTLSQSALLTLPTHVHIDIATSAVFALINGVFGNASAEKAFTSFARERVVMISRRSVATNKTEFFLLLRSWIRWTLLAQIAPDSAIGTVIAVDSIAGRNFIPTCYASYGFGDHRYTVLLGSRLGVHVDERWRFGSLNRHVELTDDVGNIQRCGG